MDSRDALEHLEMVDRILKKADEPRPYRPFGMMLILWGVGAGTMDIASQIETLRGFGPAHVAGLLLLLVALAYSIYSSIESNRNAERVAVWDRRMGQIIGAIWIVTFVAAFAQPHVLSGWALGAIWTIGAAMQLLIGGFFGDRRSLFGAIALLVSLIAGNLVPGYTGYIFAAGFFVGYVCVGISYVVQYARDARNG